MKRWALRAVSSSIPTAMSTWGGAGHPGVAGGAGGAADAPHIQQEEQGVTFCVFEGEVGVAGQSLLAGVFFGERVSPLRCA